MQRRVHEITRKYEKLSMDTAMSTNPLRSMKCTLYLEIVHETNR